MKCKECMKEGKKSTIELGACTSTCMAWGMGSYDEDGKYHQGGDDPNSTFQEYSCSNGHYWEEKL